MKLTIGMPSYNNYTEVWFTVQALRMYQDLEDAEILIVDNYGNKDLEILSAHCKNVSYVLYKENQGTAAAKNVIFEEAKGDWVFCIDSHIMLIPNAIKKLKEWINKNPNCMDLLQSPLLYDNQITISDSFSNKWSDGMWGQWNTLKEDATEPYEIPMQGMGLFGCRKDAWLKFNDRFRGFGGEEGYIHEKYHQAGKKILCLPFLKWLHHFRHSGSNPYAPKLEDKARNYVIGFKELGLSLDILKEQFGKEMVERFENEKEIQEDLFKKACLEKSDINEHLPILSEMVKGKDVVELGVRTGISTIALIHGKPKKLVSYDINHCTNEKLLKNYAKENEVNFEFKIGDSREVEVECDILFIDTNHNKERLEKELEKHASKVKDYIVLHDTETFGGIGDDGKEGLNFAIREFLEKNKNWSEFYRYKNNNGLTILINNKKIC